MRLIKELILVVMIVLFGIVFITLTTSGARLLILGDLDYWDGLCRFFWNSSVITLATGGTGLLVIGNLDYSVGLC